MSKTDVVVPEYMKFRLYENHPGITGIVLSFGFRAYVHRNHTKRTRFEPHDWYATSVVDGAFPATKLQQVIDKQEAVFMKKLGEGEFEEWKYDKEGNCILGSKRRVKFNNWVLLDKASRVVKIKPQNSYWSAG